MSSKQTFEFRALSGDKKFIRLDRANLEQPLNYEIAEFLHSIVPPRDRPLRILDFGCGRGGLVGQLRARGMEAYGVDIDERFLSSGKILSSLWPSDWKILSILSPEGRSIFPDMFFDAIVTDQVLEHVADLDALAAEMSRLLKPGGSLFHRFPGRWTLIEPHYFLPLVHWVPAGSRMRRYAAKLLVGLGLGVHLGENLPPGTKADIICHYADTHTFYRSPKSIEKIFARYGIRLSFGPFFRWWLLGKLKTRLKMPKPLLALAKFMLRSDRLTYFLADTHSWRITGVRWSMPDHQASRERPALVMLYQMKTRPQMKARRRAG